MAPSSSWNSSSKISWRWWRKKTNSLARLMSLITALSFGAGSTGGLQIGGRKATLPPTLSRQGTLLVPGSKPRPLHLRQLLFDRLSRETAPAGEEGQGNHLALGEGGLWAGPLFWRMGVAEVVCDNVEYGEEGVHIEHEESVPFP